MKVIVKVMCLLMLTWLALPSMADAGGQKSILVLDASGSMWGKIDGKAKITIAREVIAGMLKQWPADQEIGLMAYGHRRKGDCSDIEMLIPVGKLNAKQFNHAVSAINPRGKTPLTEAVKQAAEQLKYTEEKATVILISDGKETCHADPCAVAAELEKRGVDFTAHVIGFDVAGREGVSQLQCLAKNTGGEYLTAKNATELKKALSKAVEKVVEAPKVDPRAPVNLNVYAVLHAGGKKVGGNWFTVYREEMDEFGKPKRIKVDSDGYKAETNFHIKPGDYVVTASLGKAYAEKKIAIEPGKAISVALDLNAGRLRAYAIMHEGGKKVGGNWFTVYREVTDEFGKPKRIKVDSDGYKAETTFTLPAGDYVVTASLGKAYAESKVTVAAGKGVETGLNLKAGRLRVNAVLAEGGKKVGGNWFSVYREETDEFGKPKRIKVDSDGYKAESTFTVPAGDYVVTASLGKAYAEGKATIAAGKGQEVQLNLNAGRLHGYAVLAAGGSKVGGNWFTVYREETDEFGKPKRIKVDSDGYKAESTFTLPAGDYVISASKGKRYAEAKATVAAGKGVDVELVMKLVAPEYVKHLGDGKWQAWSSNQGDMGLLDLGGGKYVGFYNQSDQGRLLLQRNGNVLSGYWVEKGSNQACDHARDGSKFWGRVHWEMNASNDSFTGWWSYCEAASAQESWTGKR